MYVYMYSHVTSKAYTSSTQSQYETTQIEIHTHNTCAYKVDIATMVGVVYIILGLVFIVLCSFPETEQRGKPFMCRASL